MKLLDHMPYYYSNIDEIYLLQTMIESELGNINYVLEDTRNQFYIYTSTWSLPIWEKIFNLPVGDEETNLQERREAILSKLRSYGTTTKEMIIKVGNAFTNGGVKIIEHNEKYSFDVVFTNVIGIPTNMKDFREAIEIIKPAHLTYSIVFLYRVHKLIKPYTHGYLKQYKHGEIYSRNDILGGVGNG